MRPRLLLGSPRPARPHVQVRLSGSKPVDFEIPARARPAAAIVARAALATRKLKSLVYVESLRSGPTGGLLTTWTMKAPNEVEYRIRGGADAIVLGTRRWDRDRAGAPWRRSQQLPALRVPLPAWGARATNAYVLRETSVGGRPAWVVSFANPSTPAWFTAVIDRATYRPLQLAHDRGGPLHDPPLPRVRPSAYDRAAAMMFLVVLRRSGPEYDHSKPLEEQSGWAEHAAFMDGLVEDGFIVLGGVLGDEVRTAHAVEAGRRRRSARRSSATRGAARTSWSTRSTPGRSAYNVRRSASSAITQAAAAAATATSAISSRALIRSPCPAA